MTFERVEIGDAVLYLGDCLEVMPTLEPGSVDAVVTDPPYLVGFSYGAGYDDSDPKKYHEMMAALRGRPVALLDYPEDMMAKVVPVLGPPGECLVWAYNANTRRQSRIWGFWGLNVDFSAVKIPAKNPGDKRVSPLVSSYDWTNAYQQVKNVSAEKTEHPCQIPVALVEHVLRLIVAETVLDPFMGSGTTGVACAHLGRKFIGIEIEPRYFDIACRRIGEAQKQGKLFEPGAKPEQLRCLP
jgi:site-specific DNA-methyltransferase (adenine-specific)/modification methylase